MDEKKPQCPLCKHELDPDMKTLEDTRVTMFSWPYHLTCDLFKEIDTQPKYATLDAMEQVRRNLDTLKSLYLGFDL